MTNVIFQHPDFLGGEHAQDSEAGDNLCENNVAIDKSPAHLRRVAHSSARSTDNRETTDHHEPGHAKNHYEQNSGGVLNVEPGHSDDERDEKLHR